MIEYEYRKLNQIQQQTIDNKNKPKHFRTTESWATGLILLNWNYIIKLWESRIESLKTMPPGIVTIDEHHFELHKAMNALRNHTIINSYDYNLIFKTPTELKSYSTNQLKLWNSNIQLLNQINTTEVVMGIMEPTTNPSNTPSSQQIQSTEIVTGHMEPITNP